MYYHICMVPYNFSESDAVNFPNFLRLLKSELKEAASKNYKFPENVILILFWDFFEAKKRPSCNKICS